jgi:hypothetical protein
MVRVWLRFFAVVSCGLPTVQLWVADCTVVGCRLTSRELPTVQSWVADCAVVGCRLAVGGVELMGCEACNPCSNPKAGNAHCAVPASLVKSSLTGW